MNWNYPNRDYTLPAGAQATTAQPTSALATASPAFDPNSHFMRGGRGPGPGLGGRGPGGRGPGPATPSPFATRDAWRDARPARTDDFRDQMSQWRDQRPDFAHGGDRDAYRAAIQDWRLDSPLVDWREDMNAWRDQRPMMGAPRPPVAPPVGGGAPPVTPPVAGPRPNWLRPERPDRDPRAMPRRYGPIG